MVQFRTRKDGRVYPKKGAVVKFSKGDERHKMVPSAMRPDICALCGSTSEWHPLGVKESMKLVKERLQGIINYDAPEVHVISVKKSKNNVAILLNHPVYYKVQERFLEQIRSFMNERYGKGKWSLDFKDA
jgi:hypothetical protein